MADNERRPARRSAKLTALLLMFAVAAGIFFGVRALFGGGAETQPPADADTPPAAESYIYDVDGVRFFFLLEEDGAFRGDTFYGAVPAGWHLDTSALQNGDTLARIAFLKDDSDTGADAISLSVQRRTDSVTDMNADDFPALREADYRAQGLDGAKVELQELISERAMDRDFVRVRYTLTIGEAALFCDELYIDDGDRRVFIKMVGPASGYDSTAFILFTQSFGFYTEGK